MKQKLGRKLLRVLLMLTMVIGLMPGMGQTVKAAEYSSHGYCDELQPGDILKPGAGLDVEYDESIILQANGWGEEGGVSNESKEFSPEHVLEIRENGRIEVMGDDYTYTYCYPYVNDVKVSAWKVVSVDTDDYSTTITLTGYAPPERKPEMTFSSDTKLTENKNGYVTIDGDVTLDLAGYTITGGGHYSTIVINHGCTLTLIDSSEGKTGTLTGGGGDMGGGVAVSNEATFNMQGGTITGNSAAQGGGVYSSGTFNMSGGKITGNSTTGGFNAVGGGVVIESGDFTMSGTASITNNNSGDSGHGGGVCFDGNTFTMKDDSSITWNNGCYGAGVYMSTGTLNMSGNASVSSNTASGASGGVNVNNGCTLNMSGNAAIANNRARYEGGAIYLDGTLTMTDSASITGNSTSDKSAGGICVHNGNLKVGGGVKISGNTRNGSAEDVDLYPGKVITVTAALTEETPITVRRSDSNGQNYWEGVITANDGSSYTVQESDKAKFSPASSGQRVKWVDGQARLINLYRVTYYDNGATSGTVPTDENNPYESGSTVTVLGNTGNLAKTSHNFNGWNTAANGSGTPYAADTTFKIERSTTLYAQWEEVPHVHSFTYEADGATITATCGAEGCDLTSNPTLTIVAPTLTTYGQTGEGISEKATLDGLDAFNSATDLTVAASDIKYYGVEEYEIGGHTYKKQGDELAQVPTAAGEYVAGLTLSNVKTSETETGDVIARVWYTIAPASISSVTVTDITAPVATEALDTEAATSTANVTLGAVTWNPTTTPAAYATQYTATVIATAAANYAFADTVTATVNGQAATVTKNDGGTLTIAYTFEKTALTPVTITATDKKADWSADGIAIPVEGMFTITEGAGAATYTVTNGTGEGTYDAQTGKLTVTKCGTFTVKVSTAATDTYAAGAETTATLTVNKVDSTAATVTANTLIYTGSAQALVTVTGEATGGTMQYALGTKDAATEEYTPSIPTGTDAGTYYVWYKVVGDADHADSAAAYVTVTIGKAAGGGSSGGSSGSTITVPVSGDSASVSVSASVSGATATVKAPTTAQLDKVIGESVKTGEVTIDVSGLNRNIATVSIPTETVKAIEKAVNDPDNDADALTVKLTDGSVTFDAKALAAVVDQAKGSTIQLNLDNIGESKLKSAQKTAIKDMDVQAVYDAYMTSNGQRISDFKGGKAAVTVSYTLKDGQTGRGVVVWYVADDGKTTEVPTAYNDKTVSFTVEHFSNYVIAYDEARAVVCPQDNTCPISAFSDASATAWYHDGVHYVLESGIMNGVGNGKFGPGNATSRAMIAQILWNMEGKPIVNYAMRYTDVDADAWYAEAVRWATAQGIMSGYGYNKFGPNDDMTREQLVTIMYRYAQYKGVDVSVGEDTNILSYDDALTVSEFAIPAMQWAVGSGAVSGRTNTTLNPKDTATRAEIATIIMRYCEEIAK